jgi:drug/metabolite transporter (DMT)-like permease
MMTVFLVALVVVATSLGDLFQTIGMRRNGEIHDFRPGALGRVIGAVLRNRWILVSTGCFAVSFFAFLALLSVADLSFAVPATAAAFAVETLLAKYVLKEIVGPHRWAGALLVTIGVVLISL